MIYAKVYTYDDNIGPTIITSTELQDKTWKSFDVENASMLEIVNGKIAKKSAMKLEQEAYDEKVNQCRMTRAIMYPPIGDYIDAVVKGDTQAIQDYIDKCKAVKEKYPKP